MKNKYSIRYLALLLILAMALGISSAAAEGILPVLQTPAPEETFAISLQSATGATYVSLDQAEGGGYKYNYKDVSYACYSRFSVKLAEEGYMLVSSETLEDGTSRAVVTNGEVTLVIDYNMEEKKASVSYPPSVFARDTALYDDYTEISEGDVIQMTDHATATLTGWISKYYVKKYSNDASVTAGNNTNNIFVCFDVDYFRPESISYGSLFRSVAVRYDDQEIEYFAQGGLDDYNSYYIYNTSYRTFSGKMEKIPYVIAFSLTDEQMQNIDKVTVTFSDYDQAVRYVYRLHPIFPAGMAGVWAGSATSSNDGPPFEMELQIWDGGAGYYRFRLTDSDSDSYNTSSDVTLNPADQTIVISGIGGSQDWAKGTYEITDDTLTLQLTVKVYGDSTLRDYTVVCHKQ